MAGQDLGMPLPPTRPDPLTPSLTPAATAPAVPTQVAAPVAPRNPAIMLPGGGNTILPTLGRAFATASGAAPDATAAQAIFGQRSLDAGAAFQSDSGLKAAGDAVRAGVLGAAHAAVLPVMTVGGLAGAGLRSIGEGVGHFAQGLFGTSDAPAVPVQAAAPVVAAPAAAPGGLPTAINADQAAAVVKRMGDVPQIPGAVGQAPNPKVPITVVPGPNAYEQAAGLPAGTQRALLQSTKPSQRAAVATGMAQTLQAAQDPTRQLKDIFTTQLAQRANAIAAQGAAAVAMPKGEARDNAVTAAQKTQAAYEQLLQSIIAPPSFNAGQIPGVAQNAYGMLTQPTVQ